MKIWMRVVGSFYLLMFVAAGVARAPIRTLGPPDTLARAAAGDPAARFIVATWTALAIEFGTLGVALWVWSRRTAEARALATTIVGIELVRAFVTDVHWIARGYDLVVHLVWIAIHVVIAATGVALLRRASRAAA